MIVEKYKHAMRRFASAISIITTTDDKGNRYGMVATSVTSLTIDPPSVLTCINSSASIHTHLKYGAYMCINLLSKEHKELVGAFSGAIKGEERFKIGNWRMADKGAPYLIDAQAYIICEVKEIIPYSTHSIIISNIISTECINDINPIIYANGKICSIASHEI
jgi:flavin reductase (DIM6/NTAB) family NADH-FMN oxidoreductase RutF